jgi:hypothetical protein
MPDFDFKSRRDLHNDNTEDMNPFDALIEGAGGAALPGRYGLIQAILTTWTSEQHGNPWLWGTRNALNTIGVYRKYKKSKEPPEKKQRLDPIHAFLKRNGLSSPKTLSSICGLLFAYSLGRDHEDFTLDSQGKQTEEKKAGRFLRRHRLPSGLIYYFEVYSGADGEYPYGPYLAAKDEPGFFDEFSTLVWEANEGNDLQLATRTYLNKWGGQDVKFALEDIGAPDPYVDGPSTWTSIERLSTRVLALRRKGVSRNILFYGPPGTGKSTLARNLAKKVGDSRTLRIELAAIQRAGSATLLNFVRLLTPNVLLFDDIDRNIDEVLEVLHLFEQLGGTAGEAGTLSKMVVVATANTLATIDPALLRPGRFDEVIETKEPASDYRKAICAYYFEHYGFEFDLDEFNEMVDGFSPMDVKEVIRCTVAFGVEHLEDEVGRVRRQREHYAGDAVGDFLRDDDGRGDPPAKVRPSH